VPDGNAVVVETAGNANDVGAEDDPTSRSWDVVLVVVASVVGGGGGGGTLDSR
jgi:hypothetical protein